jgi:hypothetical protein
MVRAAFEDVQERFAGVFEALAQHDRDQHDD